MTPKLAKTLPRVLVLRCDKRVGHGGYLKIDRIALADHQESGPLNYWRILHEETVRLDSEGL
jgi:hypothetical protein